MSKKIGVLLSIAYSISIAILPVSMTTLYKAFSFATIMDVLGICLFVNAMAYLIHVSYGAKNKLATANKKDEEDKALLKRESQ